MYQVKWNRAFNRLLDGGKERIYTEVHISQDEPYSVNIIVSLEGDFSNVVASDVVEAVLDKFYRDTYTDKANQEKFQEVEETIEKSKKDIEKIKNKFIAEMSLEQEKNRAALLELGDMMAELMEKLGEVEATSSTTE